MVDKLSEGLFNGLFVAQPLLIAIYNLQHCGVVCDWRLEPAVISRVSSRIDVRSDGLYQQEARHPKVITFGPLVIQDSVEAHAQGL